jgi:hypothetical protein
VPAAGSRPNPLTQLSKQCLHAEHATVRYERSDSAIRSNPDVPDKPVAAGKYLIRNYVRKPSGQNFR